MAVQTQDTPMRSRAKRQPRAEYWIYFALLFVILLPTTLIKRVVAVATGTAADETILREATSDAHTAASMIFSA